MSAPQPKLIRAVSRWQLVGLSINDVIGSGIYLLPAATAALLGPMSLWAVVLAGIVVALLVACYAQAASCFDQPGGSYLYAREAFGPFIGFEIGWMIWLTRISSAAALSNGLADAVARFWPAAGSEGLARVCVVAGSLALLTGNNLNPRAWALDLENGLLVHDRHHHLRERFQEERDCILAHTRRISHFDQIEQIKDYPEQVRKLLARIHRVRAHILLKRII